MLKSGFTAAILTIGLGVTDAAAQTATQFDLVCSGTRQDDFEATPVAHDYRLRVDLDAERWCWDACERTQEVAEIAPDRIVFSQTSIDTLRKRSTSENSISRLTGEHRLIWIESRPMPTFMETKGRCEPVAFSGFPAALF